MEAPSQSPPTPASEEVPGPRQPKLRSTCDACQQAKVRCSHDTPRCRRCQTHKIECVYSVSRRMGRPRRIQAKEFEAKKNTGSNPIQDSMVVAVPSSIGAAPEPDITVSQQDFQDALLDPVSSIFGGGDCFDTRLNSPERTDFSSGTSSSSHRSSIWSDANLNFNSVPLWDFSGDNPSTAFSPNTLLSVNTDIIFQDVVASSDQVSSSGPGSDADFLSSVLDPRLQSSETQGVTHQPPLDRIPTSHTQFNSQSCTCYTSVLQELSRLHQDNLSPASTSGQTARIDLILRAEGGIQEHAAKVLSCNECAVGDRPSLLLLLAMVIDHIVCVLGITCGGSSAAAAARRQHFRSLSAGSGKSASPNIDTAVAKFGPLVGRGTREDFAAAVLPAVFDCPLLVGEQEISREDKVDLLKQLVQGRLGRLRLTLRQLRMEIEGHGQESSSKAGAVMVSGLQRRLQSIIGRIELWDGI